MKSTRRKSLLLEAPGKINLGLRIGKRGPRGYHSLETIFQAVSLSDELRVELAPGRPSDRLEVSGAPVLEDLPAEDNLIWKAVQKARERADFPAVKITLEKNIPVGSGLGGGSSDAAAVLEALRRLVPELESLPPAGELAFGLGADVPFFLEGGTCFARSIGEQLTPLPDQRAELVVGVPEHSVSTEWAYSNYDQYLPEGRERPGLKESLPEEFGDGEPASRFWKSINLDNDFEPLLRQERADHGKIHDAMSNYSPWTSLTGSGSGIYSLFEEEDAAREAHGELRDAFPGVEWFRARFLASNETPIVREVVD